MADVISFPPRSQPRPVEEAEQRSDNLVLQQLSGAGRELASAQLDISDTIAHLVAGNAIVPGARPISEETISSLCNAIIHCSTALGVPNNLRDLRRAALSFLQTNGD
jgi:hypothetical protein